MFDVQFTDGFIAGAATEDASFARYMVQDYVAEHGPIVAIRKAGEDAPKTLAKSLHTVTVLVNVARHLEKTQGLGSWAALLEAAIILGLGEMTDSHGLLAQARKKMDRA